MIVMYDIDDNYIMSFDNYKECAEYFNTSAKCIHCYISRKRNGKLDKKRDKLKKEWVRLFKIEEEE